MKSRGVILILVFLTVATVLPCAMHFWTRLSTARITPFPFYDIEIHPRAWANLWLQRLRVFFYMGIIITLLKVIVSLLPTPPGKIWKVLISIFWVALIFEAIDVADWFLRYGQDYLVRGFDANVVKFGGVLSIILWHIITFKHEKQGN